MINRQQGRKEHGCIKSNLVWCTCNQSKVNGKCQKMRNIDHKHLPLSCPHKNYSATMNDDHGQHTLDETQAPSSPRISKFKIVMQNS